MKLIPYLAVAYLVFVLGVGVPRTEEPQPARFARFDQIAMVDIPLILAQHRRFQADLAANTKAIEDNGYRPPQGPRLCCGVATEVDGTEEDLSPAAVRFFERQRERERNFKVLLERRRQLNVEAEVEIRQHIDEYCRDHDICLLLLQHQTQSKSLSDCRGALSDMEQGRHDDLKAVYQKSRDISTAIVERLNASRFGQ